MVRDARAERAALRSLNLTRRAVKYERGSVASDKVVKCSFPEDVCHADRMIYSKRSDHKALSVPLEIPLNLHTRCRGGSVLVGYWGTATQNFQYYFMFQVLSRTDVVKVSGHKNDKPLFSPFSQTS